MNLLENDIVVLYITHVNDNFSNAFVRRGKKMLTTSSKNACIQPSGAPLIIAGIDILHAQ